VVTGSAVTVIGAAVTVIADAVTVVTAVTVWLTGEQVGHVVALEDVVAGHVDGVRMAVEVEVVVTLRASRNWKGLAAAS